MTQKNLMMLCEAKLVLEKAGGAEPTGNIEAVVTTWGPREGADGRKFNYQPEAFMPVSYTHLTLPTTSRV